MFSARYRQQAAALTEALRGDGPQHAGVAAHCCPQAAKGALAASVPLVHPALKAVLSLASDASDSHIGGVLKQLAVGSWQPLAFFLKKLWGAVLHL
jgi:hypothetical protein